MAFFMSSMAPMKLLMEPFMALLCFSSMPWNLPPSSVADLKASATISDVMSPFDISSFSTAMFLPVFLLISLSGLKPALIICSRSCPMSFPVDDICEKASVRDWNRCSSPMLMSPICLRVGMTFSASMLKPSMVWAPPASVFSMRGVFTANSRISLKNFLLSCSFPRSVRNATSYDSISDLVLMMSAVNCLRYCAVK